MSELEDSQGMDFRKEMFCPMYWVAGDAIKDPNIRYVFAYGGASASKTYSIVQYIITATLEECVDSIVLRKFAADIDMSIYKDFKLVIHDWGLEGEFVFQKHKIKCLNGAVIDFRGLDDPEKVKGITGFTYAIMEEFNQFDEEDFKQMKIRMRGLPNQKIICIWNPVDELHWIKKNVLDNYSWSNYTLKQRGNSADTPLWGYVQDMQIQTQQINEKGNAVLLHTNYQDNWYISGHPNGVDGFRDKHTIDLFDEMRANDYDWWRVYACGFWGKVDKGDEFYKDFSSSRHVKPYSTIPLDITMPLHITFDENVNPFLTLLVLQGVGHSVRQIGEICNESPRNTLGKTLYDFKQKFPPKRGNKIIYIYGDSTSRKEDVKQEKGKDFYTIIEHTLRTYGYTTRRRVPTKNPNVQLRGGFINNLLSPEGFEGCSIQIADTCRRTIEDLLYVKESEDGKKFKKMVKDRVTEVRYQERGHCSDAFDYFILEYFKIQFQLYLKGGMTIKPYFQDRIDDFVY